MNSYSGNRPMQSSPAVTGVPIARTPGFAVAPAAVSAKAAGQGEAAAACCGASEQETCCAPAAKSSCCGAEETAGGGCGCR